MGATSWVTVQAEWGTCREGEGVVQTRGSGVFNLQVSPAAFLVFFPKDLWPDPLIICLIKSHLSLAQCAKLMGLWEGLSDPPLGVWERGLSPNCSLSVDRVLKQVLMERPNSCRRAHSRVEETEPYLGSPWSNGGDKICGLGETPCMTGSSYKKVLLMRGLGKLP